jgi:hypothetical protein
MLKFIPLISFFCFGFVTVNAQYVTSSEHPAVNNKHRKKANEENIVKIAPLGFVDGSFPVFYERRITEFFSVQAGVGLTSRNYMRGLMQDARSSIDLNDNNGTPTTTDLSEKIYSFSDRSPKLGFMFSVQPRFYFDSDAPNDGFMGISYNFYRYNFDIPALVTSSTTSSGYAATGPIQNENEKISDIMVAFGDQILFDKLVLEFSSGIGIRNVNGLKYTATQDPTTNEIDNGFGNYKQTLFNYEISVRVGYHF